MIDAGYILNHSYVMHMIMVTMLQVRSNQDIPKLIHTRIR